MERTWLSRVSHEQMRTKSLNLVLVDLHLDDGTSSGSVCGDEGIALASQCK